MKIISGGYITGRGDFIAFDKLDIPIKVGDIISFKVVGIERMDYHPIALDVRLIREENGK